MNKVLAPLVIASLAVPGFAQDGPALGTDRITQADIEGGTMSLIEIRRKGLEIFSAPINHHDGFGDGPFDPSGDNTSPGFRPTLGNNGTFMRVNGLDAQSCLECHNIVSNRTVPATLGIGGVGGIAATAMPEPKEIDIDDDAGLGVASYDGRLISPPFLFGSGGVELVAKEMTMELQALKALAQANPDTPISLDTKGVNFGTITFDSGLNDFDVSGVEGVDDDLVVQPFGRKGNNQSIREFDVGAFQFHQGIQPVEVVGENVDADNDGVVNELLIGELSALHVFAVTMDKPVNKRQLNSDELNGQALFASVGCADCHIPSIETDSRMLPIAFPEVPTDPQANVFMEIDLSSSPPRFQKSGTGVLVKMFSDLKRHNMGPALTETTGEELAAEFITPRLWGIADTGPYLHDGRALSLRAAIELHGGDSEFAALNFAGLSAGDQKNLIDYLGTLRTPKRPAKDISQPVDPGNDGGFGTFSLPNRSR